jgi:transposase InsO family protein
LGLTKAPDRKEALVAHRRARLTQFGRLLLVARVLEERWSVTAAAESMGVSRATAHKWIRRFREEGPDGLADRSSAPHRSPHALAKHEVNRIVRARRRTKFGPHRLGYHLGHPRSTVYAVLRREGLSRLSSLDRPTAIPIRYERERPGELVHIDVKKLGRIPAGGGHKLRGRAAARPDHRGRGYDYLHVAVDDRSRWAYVEVHRDERGPTCAGFLRRVAEHFAAMGTQIEAVMTDQAKNYTLSRVFQDEIDAMTASHLVTRPYRPQTNGKVERFNRTMLDEWAYVRLYGSNSARLRVLPGWVEFYNRRRPHTALGGLPPSSRVQTT